MSEATPLLELGAIVEQVRAARTRGTPARIVGAGTWLGGGRPVAASERIDVGDHTGIVTYEPGDLTLTARAGTSLADIERATAEHGQWLPLQPMGAQSGTLGATVSTASAGPLAAAFGTARDQVLGCEFVSGTGDVVRAGGRVVKNVAGFDLVRLVTGAWGTLGVLTELTVRLRARPEDDHTLAVAHATMGRAESAAAAWTWLRASEYTPLAAEMISASLARVLGIGDDACLMVRLGGNSTFVRAATSDLASLGDARRLGGEVWGQLATAEPAHAIVVRLSTVPSRIGALWSRASLVADRAGGFANATVSRGIVRCVLPVPSDTAAAAMMRELLTDLGEGCTAVGERLPGDLWSLFDRRAGTDALTRGVRMAFDPDRIMNTGILGGTL